MGLGGSEGAVLSGVDALLFSGVCGPSCVYDRVVSIIVKGVGRNLVTSVLY